jgi:tetratricopeptide (TPR) repeat protein
MIKPLAATILAFPMALAMALALAFAGPSLAADSEHHSHPAPEKLGSVSFPTSCTPAVQPAFERGVALLHSFAYSVSEQAFRDVAARDPKCAIAYWGMAMTHYHQLWEVPVGDELRAGAELIRKAGDMRTGSPRERQFIDALATYYRDADQVSPAVRAERYASAMAAMAKHSANDMEVQIFYALALIATAAPTDKTHAKQKQALAILEPLYRSHPQHPGLAHYVIHASDSTEMASGGLAAARAYSKIAPSAPHALHMPSHIFTRLGLWDDSIASNRAARQAAHEQGDVGEELHAMDYLTYAYLQRDREDDARQIVTELRTMTTITASQFKEGYAATAMPVRLAVERHDWAAAAALEPLPTSPPHVTALAVWARALGRARSEHPQSSDADIERLDACRRELQSAGNSYWATQVDVLLKEAQAWRSAAQGESEAAIQTLRAAADEEDALEKLPVTPGPVVPAREQLAELLMNLKRPQEALREFRVALAGAPRRRGALVGAIAAAERMGDTQASMQLRGELAR